MYLPWKRRDRASDNSFRKLRDGRHSRVEVHSEGVSVRANAPLIETLEIVHVEMVPSPYFAEFTELPLGIMARLHDSSEWGVQYT